jgi:hypothetical protein
MPAHNGYSSKVALTLLVDGVKLALSHVGSSKFVVRDHCDPHPAGDAEIVIEVNESAERYKVFLPHGLPGPGQLVEYIGP